MVEELGFLIRYGIAAGLGCDDFCHLADFSMNLRNKGAGSFHCFPRSVIRTLPVELSLTGIFIAGVGNQQNPTP